MTHEIEVTFRDAVAEWFRSVYGAENVDEETYLAEPRWYCDIVVDTGWARLVIEIENDADSVRAGTAQAASYAATDSVAGVPVVIVPAGHLDPARTAAIRHGTVPLVREFDADAGEFVR